MKKNKSARLTALIIGLIIIIAAVLIVARVIEENTPTKERITPEEYFGISEGGSVVIVNHEEQDAGFIVVEDEVYLPYDYVKDSFNSRFYIDIHENELLYTTIETVYYYSPDSNTYKDMNGTSYEEAYVPVRDIEGEYYIAAKLVKKYTDMDYEYFSQPDRLIIWNTYETTECVAATSDTVMRREADIKSPIVRDVVSGETLEKIEVCDDDRWMQVRSSDGYTGYIMVKYFNQTADKTYETSYVAEEPSYRSFSKKINMTWHVLGASVGAAKVKEALSDTKGVNVISPTWYKITGNDGEVSSYANKDYVAQCHELGVMVWPLIDDFDEAVDGEILYSDRNTRKVLIDRLINDAAVYGYDGINIDFEKVTEQSVEHYLQFIRELSLACRSNKLVLSIDNYVPAGHNMYYNRKEQGYWADYIIIMNYDEHWSGSDAGSVASIGFVENGIKDTLEEVPKERVINAMPFYTRIWVETPNADGTVTTTSKAVGMETAYKTVSESGYPAIWNEECGQYYCSYDYAEGNSVVKIWLEDARSIGEKMKMFEKYDLAGVSSWRLGFETSDIWDVIGEYIN